MTAQRFTTYLNPITKSGTLTSSRKKKDTEGVMTDDGLYQVLGAVGHLPSILTELEVSYYLLR